MSLPSDVDEFLSKLKPKLRDYVEKNVIEKGLISKIPLLWLSLAFTEYCRYRDVEWFGHSLSFHEHERFWVDFVTDVLTKDLLPPSYNLGSIVKFSAMSLRVKDLLYQAFTEYLAENAEKLSVFAEETLKMLPTLSTEAMMLAYVMYLDGEIVRSGRIILCNTTLGSMYLPTIRILFRRDDVTESKLAQATTELVRVGLISHCAWTRLNLVFHEYTIPPFVYVLWTDIPRYIDIPVPRSGPLEMELRRLMIGEISELERLVDELCCDERIKRVADSMRSRLRSLKRLVDRLITG